MKSSEFHSRNHSERIRSILRPLEQKQNSIYVHPTTGGSGSHILVARSAHFPNMDDFQEMRFRTNVDGYRGAYYERWIRQYERGGEILYLDRAYLHLYELSLSRKEEKEFLLLHCDPNEPEGSVHLMYKRVPHLHIPAAGSPWQHAHIALNIGYSAQVLKDDISLSECLAEAVLMIKEQILDGL